MMKLWTRLVARRQRKAHERYLVERARQRALNEEDAADAIRDLSKRSVPQQSIYGPR